MTDLALAQHPSTNLPTLEAWLRSRSPVRGDALTRVSGIDAADRHSIVFATDPASLNRALLTDAVGILASRGMESQVTSDPRILWVDDAKLAFALAANHLQRSSRIAAVHPTATIGERVTIGDRTRIGPGVVVASGVVIGSDCDLLANTTLYAGVTLGDRVVVQSGAVLGSTGFGYVRNSATGAYVAFPQQGTLVLENDVEVGANTTIDRGALGETRIGEGTKIDNLVHIAHNCRIGKHVVIAAQTGISGSTVIGDGAVIGGQVGIGDHATIGEGVILGSGSGVLSAKKLRGPGQVFWGIPAQPLKSYLRDLARFRKQ